MPTLMQKGAAWLGGQMQSAAGVFVTIQQGQEQLSDVKAWRSRQTYDIADSEGFVTQVRSDDWSFVAGDLPESFSFRAGATISSGDELYEALPIGAKPCVENKDDSGVLLVVHTKRVQ